MAPFPAGIGAAMRRLLVVRHGSAAGKATGGSDRERPLTPEGRRAVRELGERLRSDGIEPDLVLCSPAQRTRETLSLLGTALTRLPPAEFDEDLYLADACTLLDHLHAAPGGTRCLLLVGHNPGLEELARGLAGSGSTALDAGLPAAGLAIFEISGAWSGLSPSSARLAAFAGP